jgi:predicted XRE-type DNA-binding protein
MSDIEKSTGNVYDDIGRPDAAEMKIKARLAMEIMRLVKLKFTSQSEAALCIGIPQPKLSNLLRGNFSGISEAKMIECLNRLGNNVDIVVTPAQSGLGATSVVCA